MEFKPVPDSEFELKADLVLLAMGFLGPETNGMLDEARREDDRPRQRLARRALDDERARRVHRRRHAARPVAHRLGDCRRPLLRARRRPIPDGTLEPAGAARVAGATKTRRYAVRVPSCFFVTSWL